MLESSLRVPSPSTAGSKFLIFTLFLLYLLYNFRSAAQILPAEEEVDYHFGTNQKGKMDYHFGTEGVLYYNHLHWINLIVEALQAISSRLQYSNWRVSSDSCNEGGGLNDILSTNQQGILRFGSNVTCNCNTTVCHVTNIQLKGLNLTGVLPEEFANLTFLQEIDLSRNYISGTIPARFGQLRITMLSLLGNRLSGPIPREIGDITTLEELVLEDNLLQGHLPPSLGRLTRLRRVLLAANNFTGTIPDSYGNLTNLQDFRIDGNTLSGRIPSLIGNWTRLTRLDWQGTSMEGPIPSTIFLLTNLEDLRITTRNLPFSDEAFSDNIMSSLKMYL